MFEIPSGYIDNSDGERKEREFLDALMRHAGAQSVWVRNDGGGWGYADVLEVMDECGRVLARWTYAEAARGLDGYIIPEPPILLDIDRLIGDC